MTFIASDHYSKNILKSGRFIMPLPSIKEKALSETRLQISMCDAIMADHKTLSIKNGLNSLLKLMNKTHLKRTQ